MNCNHWMPEEDRINYPKYCKWCDKITESLEYFRAYDKLTYYWVTLQNLQTNECFSKVGITSKSVLGRFKRVVHKYKVTVRYERTMSTDRAIATEAWVLSQLDKDNRLYKPKDSICGWTECFI